MEKLLLKLKEQNIDINVVDGNLKLQIPENLNVRVLLDEVKSKKKELITFISSRLKYNIKFNIIEPSEKKIYFPLSSAQKRLYLLQKMNPESIVYNMPYVIPVPEKIGKEKLEEVFCKIIDRHKSFKTSFDIHRDEPVQFIHNQINFQIEDITITKDKVNDFKNQFVKAFDLSKVPLLRASVVHVLNSEDFLMLDMHHIISDGVSQGILEREFRSLCIDEKLPKLSLQYIDYCEWQNSQEYKAQVKKQEDYWINKFNDDIPVLNLPTDYPRPLINKFIGANVNFVLDKNETSTLKLLGKENGLTLYMSLLSIFTILLSKLSSQEEIIIGTPIAGRTHPNLDTIVGMFVNSLAIKNDVNNNDSIISYLGKLKRNTLEAFSNQDCQFDNLIENLSIEREMGRNPLFDVMFNLLNLDDYSGDLTAVDSSSFTHTDGVSKFDITLTAIDYGEQVLLNFEYRTELFESFTIERYIKYFKNIINQFREGDKTKISDIELIDEEERHQLLFEFNNTKRDYPENKTIYQLFEDQAKKTPNGLAVSTNSSLISYKDLEEQSKLISRIIYSKGIMPGSIICLMVERSIEMIIGIMGILRSGCCYLPIMPNLPQSRIEFILKDSSSKLVLSQTKFQPKFNDEVDFINLEKLNLYKPSAPIEDNNINYDPNSLAYIIYTSGTTGNPKGVMIENSSVVNRIKWMQKSYPIKSGDIILQKTPFNFDVSVWELFWWSFEGASVYMLNPEGEKDSGLIARIITEKKINVLHFVPSMLESFLNFLESNLVNYNFESLKYVFSSGEALKVNQVENFYKLINNKDTQLVNLYGPTEATVDVSYYNCYKDFKYKIIPIGKPIDNTQLYILEKNTLKLQPSRVVGELMISGVGLSRGYTNKPELTSEKFIPHPFKESEYLYRTGDLARWMPDGNIEFLGRIDHQVKIRGFRIELGEIESTLLKHENIKECIVLDIEQNNEKYLCAYVVCKEESSHEELRDYMSAQLPDYMLPSFFVELDSLPLTTNGKVNRKVLPAPEIKASEDYVAPSNEIEEKLVEIWSEILNIEKEEISTKANFFSIGGHSLKASVLIGRIHKETGVEFPLQDVFLHSNIRAQASQITTRDKKDFISITKAKDKECYALSSAQKRLYLLQQMDLDSTAYNMPYIIPIGSEAEKEKIEKVLHQLIKRHESFRTSFEIKGEEPVQRIHEQVEFKLEEVTLTKGEVQEKRQQFIQAFDLSKAPLLRVTKVDVKGESSLLMIDMHHIISDGVSHEILEQDFQRLYTGEELVSLSLQYKDYSEWQNSKEQQLRVKEQENYWINKFEDEIPVLNLPTDNVRPAIQKHEGASVSFVLSKEETRHIKSLAKENSLTLYMSILSTFNILLSKLSGQEDIIIGTPIAGRNHTDLENIVGVFVNILAIRNEINGTDTLKVYLEKLKQNTLEAYENQDYQFEELVEKVSVERDISRNPLFDVMFNLLNQTEYSGDLSEFSKDQYIHTPGISKFDLALKALDYGEQLMFSIDYCTKLFRPDTIERYIGYFKQIVNQIPHINNKISEIEILSTEEKQQLLHDFNNTIAEYPKDKKIHQLFEEQVEQTPDRVAIVFNEQLITYKELNLRSNQLAHLLISKGLKPEDIVGILVDRSIEMIIGILGVLKAGGTYLPLDIETPKDRINYIIEESKLGIILGQESVTKDITFQGEYLDLFESSLYLNSSDQNISYGKANNAAYIIYTSGSTGKPKGVVVEHGNVVNLVNGLTTSIYNNYQETLHVSLISPIYFDASVKQIFPSLSLGHSLNIVPESARFEGFKLVNHYKRHDIQIVDGTPFHAQLLAQHIDEKTQGLNIRQFVIGGDELKLDLIRSLFQKIDVVGLKISNVYGPTECTDVTTIKTSTIESLKKKGTKSIGKPISNYEIYILGKNLELLPVGISGELCISGAGVSRGYLFNEALSSEKFIEHPYKEGERLYRTGDLARWLPDGEIEFLGRIDHQVKIRGFRIELGEIESVLQKHENIKDTVVLAREDKEEKYLCAYIVINEDINEEEIRTYLSASLPDYMIPLYLVQLEKLPLTNNGKVNRKALPSPEVKAGNNYVAPSNATEEKLVEIWSEILNIEKEEISTKANFFAIGGHSLKASILTGRIHKEIGVEFPLRNVFIHSNIKAQADQIEKSTKKEFVNIPKAKGQEYYPLSSAQKRLYLLQQMDLESMTYNMPYIIPIGSEADKEKIEEVFKQLIKRHESFRTSFEIVDEEPVQRIHEQVEFKVEEITIKKEEVQEKRQQFIQAFDLSKAPLLRVSKVDVIGEGSLLMIDMHHIISDGVSQAILEQDFKTLYSGKDLAPPSLQYKDYSEWQNSEEQQIKVKEQGDYWIKKFGGEISVLDLPTDYVRPVIQSYEGASVTFALCKEETQHIKLLAKESDLTVYMSVLSVLNVLLSKLSGQEDIIVGTPIAGRNHRDLENIVGMFVNTLAIRNEVNGNNSLTEFTKKLKQSTLEAYENQDYQFEELVENISIERDISRNPLFDVMFSFQSQTITRADLSGLESDKYVHRVGLSKFDLTLTAVDYGEQMMLSFEYCTKLFKAETIERYIKYFKRIINQLTIKSERELSEIEIISAEEKQQLLYDFNDTKIDYPKDKTIYELFEEQVVKTPDNIALVYGSESVTYSELNKKSNQLARHLILKGVLEHDFVGILHEYSLAVYIGILGILKTGKAYLPIDSTLPDSRIQFMIKDCEIKILLGTSLRNQYNDEENKPIVPINIFEIPEGKASNLKLKISSTVPAYVIYTSGSTGNPKGVLIENKSLVNLCFSHNKFYGIKQSDRISKFAGFGFDASVWEIFPCLIAGSSLYIIDENIKLDSEEVNKYFEKKNITVSFLPTQFCEGFMQYENKSLRILLTGGDKLKYFKPRGYKLYNNYGPTENTIVTTRFEVQSLENNIPIGKPIENSKVFILDKYNQIQAIGVRGELCISGEGLAQGYLKNPELTSEKFIEHPYTKGERLYKTGDLSRWLVDGNIEFLGRIDDQVKIRGFRIELGEIENVILNHEGIKESLVIAREENGDKYLCAYLVTDENFKENEIRTYLSSSLPDYMIPSYFVQLEKLPLTINGKVNRKALPSPEIKAGDDYLAPSNETEEKLVKIWSEVLNIEKEEISTTASFFAIGGHSLKASILTGRIHKEIGVEFLLRDVFLHSSIKAQASQIDICTKKDFVSIPKAKEKEYYTLSSAQKRLYLLQQMDLSSTAYNMPYIITLGAEAEEEKEKIEEAFCQLIKRHESLRTSFEIEGEEPVQRIHEQVEFKLEEVIITKEELQNQRQQFIQAFDLGKVPLLRVSKVDIKGENSLLMIDMHHIISDGVSHAILEQDFQHLYSGEDLAPLNLQYKDYSQWQNSEEQKAKVKVQENYWINKFEEEIPVLDLPIDYTRPVIQSHEGATVSFALSNEETENIKLLAKENDLTLYMSVLSIFNILLSKLSGQKDIIIGTPIAGRNHSDLENIVGVFVNTLAIRNEVNGTESLNEYLEKLKQNTLEAYENQDYQFEDLVEKVSVERDISRNPLFDVMFNFLNHTEHSGDLSGLDKNQYVHTPGISKFDLGLTAVDYGDQLLFNFTYCTKLFKPENIERFIAYLKQIINQLSENYNRKISSLEILSEAEKQQLLHDFNNTKTDYPKDKTIHKLFEEQAEQTPDRIALEFNEQLITYNELNLRSNQIAQVLLSKGLKLEDIVGILVDRSLEMIIGILGILKAGGTYLPLDIESPKDRINYILEESELRIILSREKASKEITFEGEYLNLFEPSHYLSDADQNISQGKVNNAVYIIYTSGSTGKPKGAVVEHNNVVNLVNGLTASIYNNYHETLHVSLISPLYFDASVKQIFPTLTLGHSLNIIPESTRFEGLALVNHYARHDIQIADGTPFHAQMLTQHLFDKTQRLNIRQFVIGGDELKLDLIQNLFQKIDVKDLKISNVYGPTECTDVTTIKTSTIESLIEKGNTSIGKPISNNEVYILGNDLELLPIGVSGELCISGAGVSRGYLHNKALSSEKFIKHPYKKGQRLYRTGDLARWLPDGDIEFLGRIDYQVKIRGFRIELGEIENALQMHENIKESVVQARDDKGERYLCAYVIAQEDIIEEEIRTYLSDSLPDYMIPSYFVQLEKLPLTSNGKVNRKALPLPEIKAGDNYVAPSNATEENLVEIWSDVLKIEKEEISTTVNFFAIGGHSLKAVVLASRIHAFYDVDITIREIFTYPTIKGLANIIEASVLNKSDEEIEDIDYENIRI